MDSTLRKERQVTLELLELTNTLLDLYSMASDQLENVSARRSSSISDPDHLADFRESQADSLGGAEHTPRFSFLPIELMPTDVAATLGFEPVFRYTAGKVDS